MSPTNPVNFNKKEKQTQKQHCCRELLTSKEYKELKKRSIR